MKQFSPEAILSMSEKEFLDALDKGLLASNREKIRFYAPSFMYYKTSHYCSSPEVFPTISITGRSCGLGCKHCGGLVLDTMYPALTPEKLYSLCVQFKRKGALGCLISGGCLPDGSVPINRFLDAFEKIKRELDLTVFVHTGIINSDTAEALSKARVDAALIDVIGSDQTIKEICKLNTKVEDYSNSLRALHESGIAFIPHVIVGLHYGKLEGEMHALEMISQYEPSALVIIAFMPIRGTEMENVEPPKPSEIARVTAAARSMFPETPLVLGCMRPKGRHRAKTDILTIKAGVDAIAFPSEDAVRYAEDRGCRVTYSSLCCSQIYADIRS
jgi:uncharacterized radical SAM superfamily protein